MSLLGTLKLHVCRAGNVGSTACAARSPGGGTVLKRLPLFAAAVLVAVAASVGADPDPGDSDVSETTADRDFGADFDRKLNDALAPAMVAAIEHIRDDAGRRGVEPLPAAIRASFVGFVAEDLLDRVRWRVDSAAATLPAGIFLLRDTPAMTADNVIVFASEAATRRPLLWAHELYHVVQFGEWGVDGFVARYLADADAIEHAANEFVWRWRDATVE